DRGIHVARHERELPLEVEIVPQHVGHGLRRARRLRILREREEIGNRETGRCAGRAAGDGGADVARLLRCRRLLAGERRSDDADGGGEREEYPFHLVYWKLR